jgi:hypothetical protein
VAAPSSHVEVTAVAVQLHVVGVPLSTRLKISNSFDTGYNKKLQIANYKLLPAFGRLKTLQIGRPVIELEFLA